MGKSCRARELGYLCNSASVKKDLIEGVVKDDIKQLLLNPENIE